jgi:crotonobetainyl-CoA:carnitine CoA-transferase CaiB-like acyl-CoA transferase
MWEKFISLFDDPGFKDAEFADGKGRSKNRKKLNALIEKHTSQNTAAYWIEKLNANGCPAGEINSIDQVFGLSQVRHLGLAQPMESQERGKTEVLGQPILMSRSKASVKRPPPKLGQQTEEVLAEVGYSKDAIAKMKKDGVV